MFRLNQKAFKILRDEVEKCAKEDSAGEVGKRIVMKRLEKLRHQFGKKVKEEDLRITVKDIFPEFSDQAIKKAAKANNRFIPLGIVFPIVGVVAAMGGGVWIVNLPYPMIRRPIAKHAPMLLLPSYMSMDYNYRKAIANTEQADQLVNNATSLRDFELGEEKVKIAQKNLDALPVWFLGYEPQRYCRFFSCSWKFTLDEFERARTRVGRMEATIFQQKNALIKLETLTDTLEQAKQGYQNATTATERQAKLSAWQGAIDELQVLPRQTLAAEIAQTKLNAYQRDYREVSTIVAGTNRSNTLISAGREFAMQAAQLSQNPPHPAATWKECEKLWQLAIERLQSVSVNDPGYLDAQKSLASYQSNLAVIKIRRQSEIDSVQAFEQAQRQKQQFLASIPQDADAFNRNRGKSQLQGIVNQLKKVQSGTTVYEEAQILLEFAENKLKQLQ